MLNNVDTIVCVQKVCFTISVVFSVRSHRTTDEGWNYPNSRSGSLSGHKIKFVAILILTLSDRINITGNICHYVLSHYFLELLLFSDNLT